MTSHGMTDASANSSAVLIDEADVVKAEEEHEQRLAEAEKRRAASAAPLVIDRVSLFAVRLGQKAASSILATIATAGLMTTVAPQAVVQASALVADVQAQAVCQIATALVVHLPSDAVTVRLLQKLVSQYVATINPGCLARMTPGAAAATTVLGGALPMLVAAALQESVELSKLVAGASTKEQFARASAHVAAQAGGAIVGMAAGAAAGSFVMPGVGTGLGGLAGSYIGSSLVPMLVPLSSSSSSSVSGQRPPVRTGADDSEVPHEAFLGANTMSFFWNEEITGDGWTVVNPGGDDDDDAADDEQKQKTPAELRAEFEATARALLHRAAVVPLSQIATTSTTTDDGALQAMGDLPVGGTLLLLQSGPSSMASLSRAGESSPSSTMSSSRIFLKQTDDDGAASPAGATSNSQQQQQTVVFGDLGGRMWSSVFGAGSPARKQ